VDSIAGWVNHIYALLVGLLPWDPIRNALAYSVVYLAVAVIGGRYIARVFAIQQRRKEQEIQLARFIKERQYGAVEEIYRVFARYMALYREVNSRDTDLSNPATKRKLFLRAAVAEAAVDATILRIGSEFAERDTNVSALGELLGNLRQSVQLWRESIARETRLPFYARAGPEYERFKRSFAETSAYLANAVYAKKEGATVDPKKAAQLLLEAFGNRYESIGDPGF
jgi:hypothetical protein